MLTRSFPQLEASDYILSRARADLRRHINTRAPINKLPPELFSYIFEYAVQPNGDRTVKSGKWATGRIPEMRRLLTLSQVSSRWRAIALDTQTLWTHIDTRNKATLEAFLTYSQSKPLRLHMPTGRTSYLHRLLEQHGHRVRRFDFVETPGVGGRHPPLHLLPHLECLTVGSECDWRPDEEHDASGWSRMRSDLKALALQPYCSRMPGDSFPRLTHLHLSRFHERMPGVEAMDYLVTLLRRTPVLQFLQLSGLELESFFTSVSPPIALNSLRALTCLDSDMGAALRFLESLELPQNALVRLDGLHHYNWNPPQPYLPRPLPSQGLVASFDHLEVVTDENTLHMVAQGPRSGLWIQAVSETPNAKSHWTEWVTKLGAMLSLASIRTLHVCVLDPALLPALLPRLPKLIELAVRIHPGFMGFDEGPCWFLLDRLYTTLTPAEAFHCPELHFLGVEISTEDPDNFRLPGAPEGSEGYGKYNLLEMVVARARIGNLLSHLALRPHYDYAYPDDARRRTMMKMFRNALAPFEHHVGVVELVDSVRSVLCPLEMRDMWNVEGAEEYWDVAPRERPEYRLPWNE